ncbi:MAG: hypothetical protein NT075_14795 [Chloroflexi bacterium]|nr:hypothetical protein [Chloroflexota bacterium]
MRRTDQQAVASGTTVTPAQRLLVTASAVGADKPKLWGRMDRVTVEQHLFLSTGTLGLAIVGALGVPLLSLFSIFGLLYLNLYFLRRAYVEWRTTGLLGVTDAIVAAGLLITRQFGADALFITTYFVSHKLLQQTQTKLAGQLKHRAQQTEPLGLSAIDPAAEETRTSTPHTSLPSQVGWQKAIRQSALPFLTLSTITMPLFGAKRALAVLVTNFGYDYRVTAPLSTLTYIELAAQHEIVITDWRAFERLHQVDVLLLDERLFALSVTNHEGEITASSPASHWPIVHELQQDGRRECFILREFAASTFVAETNLAASETTDPPADVTIVAPDEVNALLEKLQAAGRTVGLVSWTPLSATTVARVDVVVVMTDRSAKDTSTAPLLSEGAHILIPTGNLEQVRALLQLADQLDHNLRRGFVITILPSIFSLSGIYFFHFGIFIPLLLDGGGLAAGLLNARLPHLRRRSMPSDNRIIDVIPVAATQPEPAKLGLGVE